MSTVTDPINQPRHSASWTTPRNWAKPVSGTAAAPASMAVAQTAKRHDSVAPQNTVSIGWKDVVDSVNPLQQLPVVGEIYRGLTGEKISGLARVAGGFIYGGVVGGLASALVAAYAEAHSGQSPSEQLMAALTDTKAEPATVLAAAPETAVSPAATATMVASASGVADDIPTVTITAQDTANLPQVPLQPVAVANIAPLTPHYVRAEAMPAAASAPQSNAIAAVPGQPLRDRLNQKRQVPGFSDSARPLNLSSFIDRLPANAAGSTFNHPEAMAQNLALLQGVPGIPAGNPSKPLAAYRDAALPATAAADTTNSIPVVSAPPLADHTGTAQSAMVTGRHNPLPPALVRDMMLQALDKYDQLPPVVAE